MHASVDTQYMKCALCVSSSVLLIPQKACYFVCLQEICLRESEVVLCGGSESMSQAPYAVRNVRFGTKFGADLKVCFLLIFLYPAIPKHTVFKLQQLLFQRSLF